MNPVLRTKIWTAKRGQGWAKFRLQAEGGLHYIKGNSAPYFSLTGSKDIKTGRGWSMLSGGCIHEQLTEQWPELADLAALHLSDINGAPSHAEDNGWYWLTGACDEADHFGEEYHPGRGSFDRRTPAQCLQLFADHCRVSLTDAAMLRLAVLDAYNTQAPGRFAGKSAKLARAKWAEICESMRPRWAEEARACIAKHNLTIYGDAWTGAAPAAVEA